MRKLVLRFFCATFLALVGGCAPGRSPTSAPEAPATAPAATEKQTAVASFELGSAAFAPGEAIPAEYIPAMDGTSRRRWSGAILLAARRVSR